MNTLPTGLTGRIIFHVYELNEVVVTGAAGDVLASRPLPREIRDDAGYDRGLYNLGYRRTSPWRIDEDDANSIRCEVEPQA
jgi:hypothetical protein